MTSRRTIAVPTFILALAADAILVLVFVLIVMGIVYGLDTFFAFVTHYVFGIPG